MAENKMEQYCKLPIPIKAYQTDKEMDIETLEGTHHASIGDWIITGVKGEQLEEIAKMFGKDLDERFTIYRDNEKIDAMFMLSGLWLMGAYENPYIDVDAFVLMELLTGRAVIVRDEK